MSMMTPDGSKPGARTSPAAEGQPHFSGTGSARASDSASGSGGSSATTAVRRSLAERFAASSAASREDGGAVEQPADGARTAAVPESSTAAHSRRSAPSPASAPEAGVTTAPDSSSAPTGRTSAEAPEEETAPEPVPGPRRVRLSLSRVDPWSVMKLAFLMSLAIGIGIVVATSVVWFVLDSMQVFADIEELLVSIGSEDLVQLMSYLEFDRVISMATIIAVVDVLLLTALSTIAAFVYNLVSALVGGLHLTLTDE